ncbi:hypothetical protein [Helicobacter sp. 11S03491-1]|uniref:hypothetical protein n=1 Tax=Helicobacter sp. 11S03491-1 TaxID=1476196 RepID=UPI000BA71DEA|nr:hypothetical protein [Helicobacter sp. 11S03491-1]PAF41292.1 hypothetical protein BKH45_07195 [Helicobacter sp. 11S03491-1]
MKRIMRIMAALLATTIAGVSMAPADELDEQIQKLEKENKILELKNKQKQLQPNQTSQSQVSQPNQSNTQNQKKVKNFNSKNGVFLGVEGSLGGNNVTFILSDSDDGKNKEDVFFNKSATFDLGLVGGYQHYFGESQRHGIKVSAHLYSGFGNSWKNDPLPGQHALFSYIPIKFGLDVKYVWDFLQRGAHTLGFNVGLGDEFDLYIAGKDENKNDKYPNDIGPATAMNNIFANDVYGVLGLHYYYGHHQFEILWRGGGILGSTTKKEIIYQKDVYTDTSSTHIWIKKLNLTLLTQSYLTLNYAYRF